MCVYIFYLSIYVYIFFPINFAKTVVLWPTQLEINRETFNVHKFHSESPVLRPHQRRQYTHCQYPRRPRATSLDTRCFVKLSSWVCLRCGSNQGPSDYRPIRYIVGQASPYHVTQTITQHPAISRRQSFLCLSFLLWRNNNLSVKRLEWVCVIFMQTLNLYYIFNSMGYGGYSCPSLANLRIPGVENS